MSLISERRLRVARLITWVPVGGIERRLVSVLPRLRERDMEVRVFCLRERGPLAEELERWGIKVELVPMKSRLHPPSLLRLKRALKEYAPDVVHSHMYRANVPGTIAARGANVPAIFAQVHNVDTWETPRQRMVDKWLCRWRTGTIGVSKAVVKDIQANLNQPPQKTPLLYNGCDSGRFRPDGEMRERTRRDLGIDENLVVALVPARLHPQKAPMETLKAFSTALDSGARRAVLVFAGDGPEREEIERAVKAIGLEQRVLILGKRDDMPELYNAADVVVLSTLKEGFSNAIVEALCCGKPVIAANVGGNAEALEGGKVGWLHEAGDQDTFASQLRAALVNPVDLDRRLVACRERGMRFSLSRLVELTDRLYRGALENSTR